MKANGRGLALSEDDPRVIQALDFLTTHINENGYGPSVRDLQEHMGLKSPSSAQNYMNYLVKIGRIERVGPRAIVIKERA